MLPGIERAVIEPAKVRDYLLSTTHPVGRFKAVVFLALGYSADEWAKLRDDLLALAREGKAVPGPANQYGQKYEVSGTLRGPNGREGRVISVWLVPPEAQPPRFVTAYPE
jgi:hypothetical protein